MRAGSIAYPLFTVIVVTKPISIDKALVALEFGFQLVKVVAVRQRVHVDDLALAVVGPLCSYLRFVAKPRHIIPITRWYIEE